MIEENGMVKADMLEDAMRVLTKLNACDDMSDDPAVETRTALTCDEVERDDVPRLNAMLEGAGLPTIEPRTVRDPANPPRPGMRCLLLRLDVATAFEDMERRQA